MVCAYSRVVIRDRVPALAKERDQRSEERHLRRVRDVDPDPHAGPTLADGLLRCRQKCLLHVDNSVCVVQTGDVPEANPFRIAGELLARRHDRPRGGGGAARRTRRRRTCVTSRRAAPVREDEPPPSRPPRCGARAGWTTALVDLEGVLSLSSIVVRIERAYDRSLKGSMRRTVDALFRSWKIGLSLGAGGFTASLQSNPRIDVESVLLRLLDLPAKVHERTGSRSFVAFDEFQDLLRVDGADGMLRSVIQHQSAVASYAFAGSAPTLMERLFEDPSRPLLEHAVPVELAPASRTTRRPRTSRRRFRSTGRDIGNALDPLLAFARGHPQRTMLVAHHLWELVPDGLRGRRDRIRRRPRALAGGRPSRRYALAGSRSP